MTDHELLELAAKAAGFGAPTTGWTCWTESEYPKGSNLKGALWNGNGYNDAAELFNPLSDDGDALRLAVKLKIRVYFYIDEVCTNPSDGPFVEKFNSDPSAATRRAIVRAAAEIGIGLGKQK